MLGQLLFKDEVSLLSTVKKYSQMVGTLLQKGTSVLSSMIGSHHNKPLKFTPSEDTPAPQQQQPQKKPKFKVDFREFICDQAQLQSLPSPTPKPQPAERPVRTFHFHINDQEDEPEPSPASDLSLLIGRIGNKKLKRDDYACAPSNLATLVRLETPEVKKHWGKVHNKVSEDWVMALSCLKEPERENRANKKVKEVREDPIAMMTRIRRRRESQQRRTGRKMVHIEQETPQIYNVKKVLAVLEQQKDEFMAQKRKKLQQEERKRQAAEEQLRRQRLAEEAEARRKDEEQREKERLERAEQEQSFRSIESLRDVSEPEADPREPKLVAPEEQSALSVVAEEENQNEDNLNSERQNQMDISLPLSRGRNEQESSKAEAAVETPSAAAQLVGSSSVLPSGSQTPPKEKHQGSTYPQLSDEVIKNNPFMKTFSEGLSLQKLIEKEATPFQNLINSSPNGNPFCLNPQPVQNNPFLSPKKEGLGTPMFHSPTHLMTCQIGNNSMGTNSMGTNSMGTNSMGTNSMGGNQQQGSSSFQSSNHNSSLQSNYSQNNSQPPTFGTSIFGGTGSMFSQPQPMQGQSMQGQSMLGQQRQQSFQSVARSYPQNLFMPNASAAKLFENPVNNVFMGQGQVQAPSLFQKPAAPASRSDYGRGSRTRKNQARIM